MSTLANPVTSKILIEPLSTMRRLLETVGELNASTGRVQDEVGRGCQLL
jgi:hypothetical protein